MNHKWQDKSCENCGITVDEYMNGSEWAAMFCPGQPQMELPIQQKTTCCNFPAIVYLGSQWICESCGHPDKDLNTNKTSNYTVTQCTCGALKLYNGNPPGHFFDCDLSKRK